MKKYLKFIQKINEENLEEIKQEIANKVASEVENEKMVDEMEFEEKPNDAIIEDIKKEIEGYEKQKIIVNNRINEINKKIEIFSSQAKEMRDEKMQANLNNKIKSLQDSLSDLEEELKKFDNLISKSEERQKKLKETNK